MRGLVCAALALCLLATAAASQSITVRSGEHGDFTRLVFRVPPETGWNLAQRGRSVSLSIDLPAGVIDPSDLFRRIGRDRLQGIRQAGPGAPVLLTLACACSAAARLEQSGLLVIDIRPNLGAAGRRTGLPWLPSDRQYRFDLASDDHDSRWMPTPAAVADPRPPIHPRDILPEVQPDAGLQLVEARLLDQITRAASQGLVKPTESALRRRPEADRPDGTDTAEVAGKVTATEDASIGVAAMTSADRDTVLSGQLKFNGPAGVVCLDSTMLDIENWGDERPFAEQISIARSGLTGEFDVVTEESALQLARTYLFFGFGAEARKAMAMAPSGTRQVEILGALADVLDENPSSSTPFRGQTGCDSDVAFWSLMSADHGDAAQELRGGNLDAAKRAFVKLPTHLRGLLGPEFSRRLMRLGDAAGAEEVLLSLKRTELRQDDAMSLAQAELDAQNGNVADAISELEDLAQSPSDHAHEAMIQLVETAWQNRGSVPPETVELLATYATERRGTPDWARLQSARALALAQQGSFAPAFALSERLGEEAVPTDLNARLASVLTRRGDDLSFLRHALADPRSFAATMSEGDRVPMVQRLLALGFPEAAADAMRATEMQFVPDRSLLNAEIALVSGRPQQAMAELSGVDGAAAKRLRSHALLDIGQLGDAAESLRELGDVDAAARAIWHAGDTALTETTDGTVYAEVGKLSRLLAAPVPPSAAQATLGGARAQLADSEATRRLVDELFQALELVTPP